MSYSRINWTNKTPISDDNLNIMDEAIYQNSVDIEEMVGALTRIPTENTIGKKKQFAVVANADGTGFDLYLCMGQATTGKYLWSPVAKDVVDLSGYVKNSTTVAGIDLSGSISVTDLQNALNTYPILTTSNEPTPQLKGETGQLCVGDVLSENHRLYMCFGYKASTGYVWELVGSSTSEVDLSGYVPNTRTVAGVGLTGDITTDELSNALEIKQNISSGIFEFSQTAIPKTFEWEQGYIDENGADVDSPLYYRSSYIPIDDGFKYILFVNNATDSAENTALYLYDESKALLAGYTSTYQTPANTHNEYTTYVKGAKFARLRINADMKDAIIRFYYKGQATLSTKKELKQSTYGQPRSLSMLDYFGANKKVVFIGDSITQGVGSSDFILFSAKDDSGNTINYSGNSEEYGKLHDLPMYETGNFLYKLSSEKFYEAIDGNGWAHKLKNYLQNRFGCSVKNYGMRGISSGTLAKYTMNSETSDLVTADEGDVTVFKGLTKGFNTVFLMIGTNDRSYEDIEYFKGYLNTIVEHLKNTDNKNVILMSANPVTDENENKPLTMAQIDEAIEEIANEYHIPFVSLYNGVNNYCEQTGVELSALLSTDGVHPNDEGYAVMQSIICESLGINDVDKNYVDKALSEFRLSDADKLDIANLVVQMMSAQSGGESDA